jgi:hypothetical protein
MAIRGFYVRERAARKGGLRTLQFSRELPILSFGCDRPPLNRYRHPRD